MRKGRSIYRTLTCKFGSNAIYDVRLLQDGPKVAVVGFIWCGFVPSAPPPLLSLHHGLQLHWFGFLVFVRHVANIQGGRGPWSLPLSKSVPCTVIATCREFLPPGGLDFSGWPLC